MTPQIPVLVIGSGITGLLIALELAEGGRPVKLLSKGPLSESNTRYAQGGMAVALAAGDSPEAHLQDTLVAGAGLCEVEPVRVLTAEAPARFQDLLARGVAFDREEGHIALTLEGAHSHRRVVHARGDATGAEIERAFAAQVRAHPEIEVLEYAFVADLVVEAGACCGAVVLHEGRASVEPASAVVLVSGGLGRVYSHTTNPPVATGDGLAMAYRAGAAVRDVEFIQFHPTALHVPGKPTFLISEAVRGEGAILRNARGEAFMEHEHPMKDLAPRDVVSRAIARQMARDGRAFVWLDLSHMPPELVEKRFPTISQVCRENGIVLPQDPIPVAPAAHYFCGGIVTDLVGKTTIEGLYAAGEVAWTGVHGANRLASNSLLECVVFGHRTAQDILGHRPKSQVACPEAGLELGSGALDAGLARIREAFPQLMWEKAGLMRDEAGLAGAIAQIEAWQAEVEAAQGGAVSQAVGELRNMLQAGWLIATAARWRRESRGCHYRLDFQEANDTWKQHLTIRRGAMSPSPSIPS